MCVRAEQLLKLMLVELGADDAKSADNRCTARADVCLTGNVIEVDPSTLGILYDALCAEHDSKANGIGKRRERLLKLCLGEFLCGFNTPANKDLVGMVVMVVMIMVMMAGAMRIIAFVIVVIVIVMIVIVMIVIMVMLVVIMMLVIVMIVIVMIVVMVIMVMMAGAMRIIAFVIVIMVIVVARAARIIAFVIVMVLVVIVMVVVMLCLVMQALELLLDGIASLHCRQKLLAVKLTPRGCYDGCRCVVCAQKCDRLVKLCLRNRIGVREHDATGVLDLIVEELAKVFHIHLALFHVDDRGEAIELHALRRNVLHRTDDIRKLANARGLDENAIGMIGCENLLERLAEIANKRAADASAVHFGHLNACVLHKAAVDANLAEFVFNQHELFTRKIGRAHV